MIDLLPPCTPADDASLKASIAVHGVLDEVHKDYAGRILDGHRRVRIAGALGLKHYPVKVVDTRGWSAERVRHYILTLNCQRRRLTTRQRRDIVAAELRRNPDLSNHWLAAIVGVDTKTVIAERQRLVAALEIPNLTKLRAKDGKSYPVRPIRAESARDEQRAVDALRKLPPTAPVKPLTLRRAERLVQEHQTEARRALPIPRRNARDIRMVHGDFRQLDLAPAGVRLIFTDPPYERAALPLWEDLGRFAKRVLLPGGLLVVYTGLRFLPTVLDSLCRHVEYLWTCAVFRSQPERYYQRDRKFANAWHPLVVFGKGPYAPGVGVLDTFVGTGPEKDWHSHQQSLAETLHFVERFAEPGALVCDPFGGSFTTAVACQRLGRRFWGCDVDRACVRTGLRRVAEESAGEASTECDCGHANDRYAQHRVSRRPTSVEGVGRLCP